MMMKMLLDVSNDGQLLSFVPWGQKCRIRRVLNFDTLYRVTFKLADYTIQLLLVCVYIHFMIYILNDFGRVFNVGGVFCKIAHYRIVAL